MNYSCAKCGRAFACEETISFCPFCGQAYLAAGHGEQAVTQRIVIGSDSERTVQEKYWKSAQAAISSALSKLRRSLPRFVPEEEEKDEFKVPKQYELPGLYLRDFKALKHCTSIAQFKVQLEDYLERLETSYEVHAALLRLGEKDMKQTRKLMVGRRLAFELGEWSIEDLEDERSINIDREAEFINGYCRDLAETVGSMNPERLQPELEYDPESIDWVEQMKKDEEWDAPAPMSSEHGRLMRVIMDLVPTVMSAINQNSLFVLSAMQFDVGSDMPPGHLSGKLAALKDKDFDPIFGEQPEHLIEAFSDAVVYMTNYLKALPDYEDVMESSSDLQLKRLKEKLDHVKLNTLFHLIEAWNGIVTQELDKLYQSQSENMVDVYNALKELEKELQN